MAVNARFELTSSGSEPAFVGNYPNGQRGNHSGPSLARSGSFREGTEGRMFGSGIGMSRGSATLAGDLPLLSNCLTLEPIIIGNQKYTWSGELRRVMGYSVGSTSEDNSFGAAHLKHSPPMAMEELKRFRSSVVDTRIKARGRAKKLDEHLHKLNKYCEAVTSKKKQCNELSKTERTGGLDLKMGNHVYRSAPDTLVQKLEDRPKNVLLSKRVRTSVAETRADCQASVLPKSLATTKDQDFLKDSGEYSDLVGEKIRRLPAGGEGWDKKMKRKRSVGNCATRPIDRERHLKRVTHQKLSTEPGLQSCDTQGSRAGASPVPGDINKNEGTSSPASSSPHVTPKSDLERTTPPRDLTAGANKERLLMKGSNKLKKFEGNHVISATSLTKGKASRAPRTTSIVTTNSSTNTLHHPSGTFEGWEDQPTVKKAPSVGEANNRKRALSSGSSPPMAQWVGQRPPKFARARSARRSNLVSPASNHDEMQISSEGCSPSEFDSRLTSKGTNGSLLSRNAANGTQQFKVKLEDVQSPARLSESEESGATGNRSREKSTGSGEVEEKAVDAVQKFSPSALPRKQNKFLIKEEIGTVLRPGRNGRGSSFSRASIPPVRDKLDCAATAKPLQSTRPASEKNGSKSGRPLKKQAERRNFSRLSHMQNTGSPDFTGESDDDREELSTAGNLACNASYLACSSPFWKLMEPIFASISLEDKSYVSQQLKFAEELPESLPQMFGHPNDVLGDVAHDGTVSDALISGEGHRHPIYQMGLEHERRFEATPLYQRVLSALIVEDEIKLERNVERNISVQNATTDLPYDTYLLTGAEPRKSKRAEFECESLFGVQPQRHGTERRFISCNGSDNIDRSPSIQNPPCNGGLLEGACGFMHSEVELLAGISRKDLDKPEIVQTKGFGISSNDCQYDQMCLNDKLLLELHSIGLYLEIIMPDLEDDDEGIDQEIAELNKGLHQQIGKKKKCLDKVCKAIGNNTGWDLEQVAMDSLVELAYKKLLATRGTSRAGVARVPKQVAFAFAKRTLARCRKFEDSGTSCFSEPALQDIILAAPPWGNEAEPSTSFGLAVANTKHPVSHNHHLDPRTSSGSFPISADGGLSDAFETFPHLSGEAFAKNGPIINRGKKKEVLLDDLGSAALRASSILGGTLLVGTKGKRSERDRGKDTSTKNAVARAGRPSQGNFKGERKTKSRPKQKTAQLSTSQSGIVRKFQETTHPVSDNRKREARFLSPDAIRRDSSKESKESMDLTNFPMHDLDPIEELGVSTDLGGHQDLGSLFNFEDDGLEDHFSAGLEIPMDDLSNLNMF
ncbi:hypothetical protein LguiB_035684 [Lonicera macranthoides]